MKARLFVIGVALLVFIGYRSCQQAVDGGKARDEVCETLVQQYGAQHRDRIRQLVEQHHEACFKECYKIQGWGKHTFDSSGYLHLMQEKVEPVLGPPPPPK